MTFEFRDAVRKDVPLLILLAGGTGSGKTESALRLATGLSSGKPFVVIDTERGRALHKADDYTFKHCPFEEPFTPERYVEVIAQADGLGLPVIVIDSGSHEYEGEGGVLDIREAEFERLGRRNEVSASSWIPAKARHKKYRNALLRTHSHVIVCHRAEDKIEIAKEGGKTVVRPKQTLTGADGWVPICERRLPFEATISLLLTADAPGFPKPIKLEERHAPLVPLNERLSEDTGRLLGEWAAGGAGQAVTLINAQQQNLILDAAKEHDVDAARAKQIILDLTGQDSSAGIPADKFSDVLDAFAGVLA